MPILYNCRHAGDEYRITKFNSDFDMESSYLCTLEECECPAGHQPICRHREMLPKFIARDHIGDEWLFDYDRGGWVQGIPSEAIIAEADENIRDLTFELEHPDAARHRANRAVLEAGGRITTEYKTDGSVKTYATINHEPATILPLNQPPSLELNAAGAILPSESGEPTTADTAPQALLDGPSNQQVPAPTIRRRV